MRVRCHSSNVTKCIKYSNETLSRTHAPRTECLYLFTKSTITIIHRCVVSIAFERYLPTDGMLIKSIPCRLVSQSVGDKRLDSIARAAHSSSTHGDVYSCMYVCTVLVLLDAVAACCLLKTVVFISSRFRWPSRIAHQSNQIHRAAYSNTLPSKRTECVGLVERAIRHDSVPNAILRSRARLYFQ